VASLAVPYFSTKFHKLPDFRKTLLYPKCVFRFFCTNSVWKIYHFKNDLARYYHKFTQACMFIKLEFSRQIFRQKLKYQIYKNSSSGGRNIPTGRPDELTCMTKLTVVFRNFQQASQNRREKCIKICKYILWQNKTFECERCYRDQLKIFLQTRVCETLLLE
jgi:hypothetical protein